MLTLGSASAAAALRQPAVAAAAATGRLLATLPTNGEQPRDQAGSMAHGKGMSVQAPLPQQQLANPAAEEPTGWRCLAEKAQVRAGGWASSRVLFPNAQLCIQE